MLPANSPFCIPRPRFQVLLFVYSLLVTLHSFAYLQAVVNLTLLQRLIGYKVHIRALLYVGITPTYFAVLIFAPFSVCPLLYRVTLRNSLRPFAVQPYLQHYSQRLYTGTKSYVMISTKSYPLFSCCFRMSMNKGLLQLLSHGAKLQKKSIQQTFCTLFFKKNETFL